MNGSTVDREHVEDDEHHLDPPLAVKHPIAQPREARQTVIAERDELAIDRETVREVGKFGDEAGDVPAAPAHAKLPVLADVAHGSRPTSVRTRNRRLWAGGRSGGALVLGAARR